MPCSISTYRCHFALPAVVRSRLLQTNCVSVGIPPSKTVQLSSANNSCAYLSSLACSASAAAFLVRRGAFVLALFFRAQLFSLEADERAEEDGNGEVSESSLKRRRVIAGVDRGVGSATSVNPPRPSESSCRGMDEVDPESCCTRNGRDVVFDLDPPRPFLALPTGAHGFRRVGVRALFGSLLFRLKGE